MNKSARTRILSAIRRHGRGWTFCAFDFFGLAARYEIDEALSTLLREGTIRRVIRGVYDWPRRSRLLGRDVAPDADAVATALARKFHWSILPSDADTANRLGLSTQVSGRRIYLTDGPRRHYRVGGIEIEFYPRCPRERNLTDPMTLAVVRALKGIGRRALDEEFLANLRRLHTRAEWRRIARRATGVSAWIREVFIKFAEEER